MLIDSHEVHVGTICGRRTGCPHSSLGCGVLGEDEDVSRIFIEEICLYFCICAAYDVIVTGRAMSRTDAEHQCIPSRWYAGGMCLNIMLGEKHGT